MLLSPIEQREAPMTKSVHEFDGEFYAYNGSTLVGIYTLSSRAWEALGRF